MIVRHARVGEIALANIRRAVFRTVVDKYDLDVFKRLVRHAVKTLNKILFCVIDRVYD